MSATLAAVVASRRELVDIAADPSTRIVVLGASRDPNGKVTLLVLPRDAAQPRLAIKVPTTPGGAHAVEREWHLLEALHRIDSNVIRSTVPVPLECATAGDKDAMVLTYLSGTPMTTSYHRFRHTRSSRQVARDLRAVATWLVQLHEETAGCVAAVDMDGGAVQRLKLRFPDDSELIPAVANAERACAELAEHRCVRTVVHGDLWCGNVLLRDGMVTGVVDWEEADLQGEPLRDLARFALTYALYLDRHTRPGHVVPGHPGFRAITWGSGIDYLLNGNGWICDMLRTFLRLGMHRLGVPGRLWPQLVVAGVAEVAARADHHDFARAHLRVLARAQPAA